MKKIIYLLLLLAPATFWGQVVVGTPTPVANSAALQLNDSNKGLLIPRMTMGERNAIVSPATGLLIYQTDNTEGFWYYNGSAWVTFSGDAWSLTGDAATSIPTNKIGTTDSQPFVIKTNNTEAFRIDALGKIIINNAPANARVNIANSGAALRIEDGNQANGKVLVSDANGNVNWAAVPGSTAIDADWLWNSGTLNTDPIYRTGSVLIGKTGQQGLLNNQLHIHNNALKDTRIGLGSTEFVTDHDPLFRFSHSIVPATDNTVGIGKSGSRWLMVYAVDGVINTSDSRDKKEIEPLRYGLKSLMQLNPVHFTWKNEQYGKTVLSEKEKTKKIGFLAQELQNVLPETVQTHEWVAKTDGTGYEKVPVAELGVSYHEIVPVIIKAIQEEQNDITALKARQAALLSQLQKQIKK